MSWGLPVSTWLGTAAETSDVEARTGINITTQHRLLDLVEPVIRILIGGYDEEPYGKLLQIRQGST